MLAGIGFIDVERLDPGNSEGPGWVNTPPVFFLRNNRSKGVRKIRKN